MDYSEPFFFFFMNNIKFVALPVLVTCKVNIFCKTCKTSDLFICNLHDLIKIHVSYIFVKSAIQQFPFLHGPVHYAMCISQAVHVICNDEAHFILLCSGIH